VPPGNANCVNVIPFTRPTGEIDLSMFQRQFDQLRQGGCELLVASVHWGREYEFFPTARQVELGHRIAELGADIVLGHHPHNIQPVEIYQVEPDRRAIICHSMGNLTSPFSAPYLVTSLLVRISVVRGLVEGRQQSLIESVDVVPVFQDCVLQNGVRQTRLMRLTTALRGDDVTERASAEAGASYADLVLGSDWREVH
jgi:poly-gamma-glutamate capsule biosynthesis protein CapA/YwtB (metallophosphatase superfamily)